MALEAIVHRAFSDGEIAPALSARADLALYGRALRTCRNFLVQRHGGVANRSGTQFVAEVKDSSASTWLLKFVYNATQTYVLELGEGYIRFFRDGERILVSGVSAWSGATTYNPGDLVDVAGTNYYAITESLNQTPPNGTYWYPLTDNIFEIPTPFLANLHLVRAVQDVNVVTLTHQDYPPQELTRLADTQWTLAPIITQPSIEPPASPAATPGTAGALNPIYLVTAVAAETFEESIASAPATCALAAEPTDLAPNVITWTSVSGAVEYRVYKDPLGNGTFGYIGTATGVEQFNDGGFAPAFDLTPPQARSLFASANTYPHTAAYYQQRRVFANSHAQVATSWASRIGFPSNFSIRSPLQDDDAVTWGLSGRQVQGIQHLVGLKRLLMLTDGGEWIVHGDEAGVLTPSSIHPDQDGFSGSAAAPVPTVLGSTVIFTQYLSRVVRSLRFNANFDGFESSDLTIFASHLFANTVVRMDAALIPFSIVWCVRDDGVLLGLTYLPELESYGWHRHDTGASGLFEDVCVVPEGSEHSVYVLVNRTVNGSTVRYLERFAPRVVPTDATLEDQIFLDCSITQLDTATTSVTGLDHLEGEEVYAFADGLVQGPFTVDGGEITLTTAAALVHVGLRITAELETLELDVAGTDVRAKEKRIQSMSAIVESSVGGFYAGPDEDHLHRQRHDTWLSATGLKSDQFEVNLTSAFNKHGRTVIRHVDPTPLSILGLIPKFQVGG
jgi:hypothetical protein